MKKVLYLIDTLAVGGSERSLLEVARGLTEFQPAVCHLYRDATLRDRFEAAGVEVVSVGLPGRYQISRAVREVRAEIRERRPDLLHTTLFRSDIVGRIAGRLEGLPVISSFINDSYDARRWGALGPVGRLKLRGVLLADRLTARWADRFLAVSTPTAEANARALGIGAERIRVVYRGRRPDRVTAAPGARERVRTELGIGAEDPVVINVARLLVRKGHEELLRAGALLADRFPQLHLVIAGEGHDRERFERLSGALGIRERVHLPGRRDDVGDLLAAGDVFAFPSHFEGHPGALVEAMLAGCAIVASDIPVNREMLGENERGRLADVGNASALAGEIAHALDDPAESGRRGGAARGWASERFTVERMVEGHEAVYRELLAEGRP